MLASYRANAAPRSVKAGERRGEIARWAETGRRRTGGRHTKSIGGNRIVLQRTGGDSREGAKKAAAGGVKPSERKDVGVIVGWRRAAAHG